MEYNEIYSRSYMKKYDPEFYKDEEFAREVMKEWLHEVASIPFVRQAFKTLEFDDEMEILTYELENSVNKESDDDFVIKVFSDGFVICWMKPKVESAVNLAFIVSGKDEKKLLDHYQPNIDRLEKLEIKLKKYIRDYGYHFGSYGTEQ